MTKPDEHRCIFCNHWRILVPPGDPPEGQCHKRAPVFDPQHRRGRWPVTLYNDVCGEFERVKVEKAKGA